MVDRAVNDPFLERFFSRVPRHVATSFTDDQLLAIKAAFATEWRGRHPVDLRLSVSLLFARYYVVLVAGPEKRSRYRRTREYDDHPVTTAANIVLLAALVLFLLSPVVGILYVLKSALGIDLLPGVSLGIWDDIREQFRMMTR